MDMLSKLTALRDEAWEAVVASGPFAMFKKLDEAVLLAGGGSRLASGAPKLAAPAAPTGAAAAPTAAKLLAERKRPDSHAAVAEKVLRNMGEPLRVGELLAEARANYGLQVSGSDPLSNFRSALSKDERFYSLKKGGSYFWWLKGVQVPQSFEESEGNIFAGVSSDSLMHSSQEGGGADATTPN